MGRPIIVFVARNFPAQSIDMNKVGSVHALFSAMIFISIVCPSVFSLLNLK